MLLISAEIEADTLLKQDENGLFHAHLERVQLTELKKFFEKEYGIQFKGEEFLFQTTITISFENLSLEKALKRVLIRKNYAITYNSVGKILEVTLLPGTSDTLALEKNTAIKSDKKSFDQLPEPFQETDSVVDDITRFKPVEIEQNTKESSAFKVIINSPPGEEQQ
jgi:hypothetical protein